MVGVVAAVLVAVAMGAPAAHSAFDPAYEARNFAKTTERATGITLLPGYQAQLRARGLEKELEALQIIANDPPPAGRLFLGQLCWQHMDGCAGDTRLYDWSAKTYGKATPILFTARNGSQLSGHLWATVAGPARRPGVVITNGSVQAPEELYWYAAQTLAKAGYVVMTWDPQGQGYSDTFGDGADRLDGVPSQTGRPFYDGTEDALDFFFSGPGAPYAPRRSCTSGTDHSPRQNARVKAGLNSAFNPLHEVIDYGRVGLVGHSLGASAISYVGQLDPRVKAIVAYDNLSAAATPPQACASGSSARPVPAVTKPALGMSADYGLTPQPNLSEPSPLAKSAGSLALSKAGVDTAELIIRGGTHYEFSFIPNPAFGGTLRGEDMVSWYTTAWLDRYVKGGDPTADERLLTDRWRNDAPSGAVDPDRDPNMYSRYYRSRLDLHTTDGKRLVCEDVRATGCALKPDSLKVPYSFLEAANRADAVPSGSTPAPLTGPSSQAAAGSTGTPVGASGGQVIASPSTTCRDTTAPVSRVTRSSSRVSRKGLTLRGRSADAGCDEVPGAVVRVEVSVARQAGKRCRFLQPDRRFGAPRSCLRASYLPAKGTRRWSFRRRMPLRRGTYRLLVRGADASGNVERSSSGGPATLTLKVR
jgi:dienelactone hydrolase